MEGVTTGLRDTTTELERVKTGLKTGQLRPPLEDGEIAGQPTPMTYAQTAKGSNNHYLTRPQPKRPEAAIRANAVTDRRFFVKSDSESTWSLSEAELAKKANLTIEKLLEAEGSDKDSVKVIAVIKLRGKGAFCVLRSADEMEWMETGDIMKQFSKDWGTNTVVQPSHHEVIAEFVPTTANLDSPSAWENIAIDSGLPKRSIVAARWVRKPEHRKPGQK
ncbi:hypothetical protein GGU11DRAFT_761005, partial [Lentinula aff. detonsa]